MLSAFEKITQPGISIMQQLRLPAKFSLISLAFLLPLAITLYAVVNYANAGVEFAVSELRGTTYLRQMNQLLPKVIAAQTRGAPPTGSELSALQQLAADDHDALNLNGALTKLAGVDDVGQYADQLLNLYANVGDKSNLILDPDLDSYYVMTIVVDYAPKLVLASAQLQKRLATLPTDGTVSSAQGAEVRILLARLEALQHSVLQALQRAIDANADIGTPLQAVPWQAPLQALSRAAATVDANDLSTVATKSLQFDGDATRELLQLANVSLTVLDKLLDKRIDGFKARRNLYLLITLCCLLASAYLMTTFYLCDARGLEALITRMTKLARGDLTVNYPARGCDEIGLLINSFNTSRAQLQVLVQRIHHAADTIHTAGNEIAAANMDLASRGAAQSAVIGETTERVKQISEKVQANLQGSSNANQIAEAAYTAAGRGKSVVDSVVTTMDAMTGSSKRIGAIIDVINEIAFQTNLLALNAAVEAARAGEQGRGFAVVAGEVRQLAQRCAKAANEITGLIKHSVDDVQTGVGQVAKAGTSMSEILASVRTVSDIMGEMAMAGKTQAEGIRVVEKAVMRIDDDAQQNAALVEQTASAAELLREQVGVLMESVTHFKLGSEDRIQTTAPQLHQPVPASHQASRAA